MALLQAWSVVHLAVALAQFFAAPRSMFSEIQSQIAAMSREAVHRASAGPAWLTPGNVVALLFQAALPVFLLIWLRRADIVKQMAYWGSGPFT